MTKQKQVKAFNKSLTQEVKLNHELKNQWLKRIDTITNPKKRIEAYRFASFMGFVKS